MAILCADEYRRIASTFIRTIPTESQNAISDYASKHIPQLAAAATNLSLSFELYLKTLRSAIGLGVPKDHDLWALYRSLPSDARTVIERKYANANRPSKPGYISLTLQVRVAAANTEAGATGLPPSRRQFDVKSVLIRNQHSFREWRYLYERGQPGRWDSIHLDVEPLDILCGIVREGAVFLHRRRARPTTG